MKAQTILILYLVFFAAEFFFQQLLTVLNIRYVNRRKGPVPEVFREAIDADSRRKAAEYTIAKSRFGMVERAFSAVFLLLLILTGCMALRTGWTLKPPVYM